MGVLITTIVSIASSFIGSSVVRWLAFKVVLTAVFVVVLPVVLHNFLISWGVEITNYALSKMANLSGINAVTYQFTGLFGWLALKCRIIDAVGILFGGVLTKRIIHLIPFVG